LRTYLLGYRPKTYLKTAKKCSRRASSSAGNRKSTQKQVDLGIKSSQGRLFMCADSYEICSAAASIEVKDVAL
jgi:hypothetical protein